MKKTSTPDFSPRFPTLLEVVVNVKVEEVLVVFVTEELVEVVTVCEVEDVVMVEEVEVVCVTWDRTGRTGDETLWGDETLPLV